jgi:ribosome recycling factor
MIRLTGPSQITLINTHTITLNKYSTQSYTNKKYLRKNLRRQLRREFYQRQSMLPFDSEICVVPLRKQKDKGGKKDKGGSKKGEDEEVSEVNLEAFEEKMVGVVGKYKDDLNSIKLGKAEPAMIAEMDVGGVPLKAMANIGIQGVDTLAVSVFDTANATKVSNALLKSDMNLDVSERNNLIVVKVPKPSVEFKKQLVRRASDLSTESKNEIRNIRRDAITAIKKVSHVEKDEIKRAENEIQQYHDKHVRSIEDLFSKKERELK